MIVREVMTTRLITVAPDDTLSHAANLLRQHQFHHLPVVRQEVGIQYHFADSQLEGETHVELK